MTARPRPDIRLRAFSLGDVDAHNAGEDEETVRWLTEGHPSTAASTTAWIIRGLEREHGVGGEIAFAVELDGRLAGMVAVNPDAQDGVAADEVNVSYAVHPWARRRGVATAAVLAAADEVRSRGLGTTLVIRAHPDNVASLAVADACGFVPAGRIETSEGPLLVRRLGLAPPHPPSGLDPPAPARA